MGASLVQLSGVSKWFSDPARVLNQLDLELKKGEFIYIVGGSGAGKTTLLKLLATEERPSSGTVSLFGYDLGATNPATLCAIRRSIGYIPQNIRLLPDLSVFDNVLISLSMVNSKNSTAEVKQRITDLLDRLGLSGKANKNASTLSGGEAQRVAIARALIRAPELLIADEPTGAQDRDLTWTVLDLFLKANLAGTTVVLATHDQEIVRRVRKRCALLKGGRLGQENSLCMF